MREPGRDHPQGAAAPSDESTVQVERPPLPGRAVRAQLAAGELATPPVRQDEPTVTLSGPSGADSRRTQELRAPAAPQVTVGPRERPRRRTWPWIVAVAVALAVLGVVLLVMLWQGATIDGDVDLLGWADTATSGWT